MQLHTSIVSGRGPMKTMFSSPHRRAKAAFSLMNPYPARSSAHRWPPPRSILYQEFLPVGVATHFMYHSKTKIPIHDIRRACIFLMGCCAKGLCQDESRPCSADSQVRELMYIEPLMQACEMPPCCTARAWVDGVHALLLGHRQDALNVQVAGHGALAHAHLIALVRLVAMRLQPVCWAVDGQLRPTRQASAFTA